MRHNQKWLDVDWVQLGCYGWEIDGSGAEAPSTNESDFMHLDRTTLHIVAGGSAVYLYARLEELSVARVIAHSYWQWSGVGSGSYPETMNTGTTAFTSYLRLTG